MSKKLLIEKYNLSQIDRELGDNYWSPVGVTRINDFVLRMAAVKGEFYWHSHKDDEFFLVYKGSIVIDTENGSIELNEGEGTVISKGVRHNPKATERAVILLFEPEKVNTRGD